MKRVGVELRRLAEDIHLGVIVDVPCLVRRLVVHLERTKVGV